MKRESKRALEPMCALDPLLLIPRIEYVDDVYEFVLSQLTGYCLVILDMKNFHIINDLYGYDIGDRVIEQFIAGLRRLLPAGSVSLRFRHGDEFLFFVPRAIAQADSLFKSYRGACEATPALTVAREPIFVSYRFGVTDLLPGETVRALLVRAENALRAVKGQGSPRS
jgi:diguanylate cyclase (GGDEF)-like protein